MSAELLTKLKKLQLQRSDSSPFAEHVEFHIWADKVLPLLSFDQKLYNRFRNMVLATKSARSFDAKQQEIENINSLIGLLNQAVTSLEIKDASPSTSHPLGINMDIKTRFESHPVVFGLTLIVIGFIAGFGARGYFSPASASPSAVISCNPDGVAALTKAHNDRLQSLQKELSSMEAEATNMGHLDSNKIVYRDSAERIRKDVAQEATDFQISVAALKTQCSK